MLKIIACISHLQDTIYSLATPFAKSAIAVIRISGPLGFTALKLCQKPIIHYRKPYLRTLLS